MNTENTEQQLIADIDTLSKELLALLTAESDAMKERNIETLTRISSEKNTLLSRLQGCDEFLSQLFARTPETAVIADLKATLQQCHSLNSDNRTVALVELKHTNNSIELLRSLLNLDDVPLYGAYGKITVSREKRNLGVV